MKCDQWGKVCQVFFLSDSTTGNLEYMSFKKELFPNRMWMSMDQMFLFHLPLFPSCPPRKREKRRRRTSISETIWSKGWTSGSQLQKKPNHHHPQQLHFNLVPITLNFLPEQYSHYNISFFLTCFLPGLYFPLTQVSLNHCHDQVNLKCIQAKCAHGDLEEVTKTSFQKDEESKNQAQSFIIHLDFTFPNSQCVRNWRHLPLHILRDILSPICPLYWPICPMYLYWTFYRTTADSSYSV